MLLAFYKTDNSLELTPDSFQGCTSEEILDQLEGLDEFEWRCYDISQKCNSEHPALNAFVDDYNNEELDLGWWCVLIDTEQ